MMYKTFNKSKQVSSQCCYCDFNKKLSKFISKASKNLSDFLRSLFTSKPYSFDEYSTVKQSYNSKNITDFYLTESRRTFL